MSSAALLRQTTIFFPFLFSLQNFAERVTYQSSSVAIHNNREHVILSVLSIDHIPLWRRIYITDVG